jgi:hypothetical protein
MNKLIAYHGKQAVKDEYLARVRAHREADQLVKGHYWQNGKGCAVGCTIHGSQHRKYEDALGIPRQLAYLEDRLFEALPDERSMVWPEEFLQAIEPGADLTGVVDRFLHWLLVDPVDGVIKFAKTDEQRAAITYVAELYVRKMAGVTVTSEEWQAAREKAWSVRYAAYAAAYAADAAYAAYAADAAADAAYAAYAADAADAADDDVRGKQADQLLELMRTAPMAVNTVTA